jgi:hypothetical protein
MSKMALKLQSVRYLRPIEDALLPSIPVGQTRAANGIFLSALIAIEWQDKLIPLTAS